MDITTNRTDEELIMTCGVYGLPDPLWQRGIRLDDPGINAVFVSSDDINQQIIERTRAVEAAESSPN